MQFNELHLGTLDKNPNACLICKGSHAIPIIRPQLGHKRRCFLGKLMYFFHLFYRNVNMINHKKGHFCFLRNNKLKASITSLVRKCTI